MNDATRQSLLLRAQRGDETTWQDLAALYRPLLLAWLRRQAVPAHDLDDLLQEVLLTLVKHLPAFEHSGQAGAFRSWLRIVVSNRACDFWRSQKSRATAAGGETMDALQQLEDPHSDLNRHWDDEHDLHVLRCLLAMVEQEFEASSLQAFRRLAFESASGAAVATELGLSVAAVYQAKSRVLQRIRQLATGLID